MALLDNTGTILPGWMPMGPPESISMVIREVQTSSTPGPMSLDQVQPLAPCSTISASDFFTGNVDEASFWDKALSATEIRALMHQPPQGNEANLKAYYRLDDGAATRALRCGQRQRSNHRRWRQQDVLHRPHGRRRNARPDDNAHLRRRVGQTTDGHDHVGITDHQLPGHLQDRPRRGIV